ncbi:isoaspartyl peptidase/L-asparaginase [Candidatus Fermentibacterales bacterium]|nr:isoaspartyl peptidase/L-asparaginase [Candidatus Fermentibacterales bacterium]
MSSSLGVIVHGGVGSPIDRDRGCKKAVAVAREMLLSGSPALEAVVEAVAVMEDDPEYNAGTGSRPRLDMTVEMDAGLMTSDGELGIVAAIRRVKNPIRVALEVMRRTPHIMLAGEGALSFARRCGFGDHDPLTDERRQKAAEVLEKLRRSDDRSLLDLLGSSDTVGAVALDSGGGLAAANSTGGTVLMLPGRVGDSPIVGAGFYVTASCAVATTGVGEEIVRRMSALRICDAFEASPAGTPEELRAACEREAERYPREVSFGVIAMCRQGAVSADNRTMPVVSWFEAGSG